MDTLFQKILLVAGVCILALALRTFAHPLPRKAGALLILGASYLVAWLALDSHVAGLGAVLAWFFLPWIELLTRVRGLRLPLDKKLSHTPPPSSQRFPALQELTEEIEEAGFEYVDDTGWQWEGMDQFFRIFYHAESRTEATICLTEQNELGFSHIALTNRDRDGLIWRTWNYPFSHTMAAAPQVQLHTDPGAESFIELLNAHEEFLLVQAVELEDFIEEVPEEITATIEEEVQEQIAHNFSRGLIAKSDDNTFRYSWRGLFFLWAQFVKDMVRLS